MSEDLIRREDAYAVLSEYYHHRTEIQHKALREALDMVPSATQTNDSNTLNALDMVPSAHSEPLSDAYMKAVWIWLLDYQLKTVEMKGKYTPYEVLSWVVNDWRKEHGPN